MHLNLSRERVFITNPSVTVYIRTFFMLNSQTRKHLLRLKGFTVTSTTTLKCIPFTKIQIHPPFSSFSLKLFSTTTSSDRHSFTVSYLINNCGFSPETALNASLKLSFDNPQKPDSVLSFFRTLGFSNPQIRDIIRRELWLLSCDPNKVLFPKIEFLRSKGASPSDIVRMVSTGPRFLSRNLENHIIPAYEFLKDFFQSDKQIIVCLNRNFLFLSDGRVASNVKLLLDNGLTHSSIAMLLRTWPSILCSNGLLQNVEELKEMGFNSSTKTFVIALMAKRTVNKAKWTAKVETFEKWGWSQEQVLQAFRKQPYTMLSSAAKIDAILSFWVNQLGLNSLDLVKAPMLFLLSLEKRIIPRASVVQFLISKGLRKKDASMYTPFLLSDKMFLQRFVKCFEEESSHLLKLYEEKLNPASCK